MRKFRSDETSLLYCSKKELLSACTLLHKSIQGWEEEFGIHILGSYPNLEQYEIIDLSTFIQQFSCLKYEVADLHRERKMMYLRDFFLQGYLEESKLIEAFSIDYFYIHEWTKLFEMEIIHEELYLVHARVSFISFIFHLIKQKRIIFSNKEVEEKLMIFMKFFKTHVAA